MFSIFSNKPLSELSLEELKSREQSTRTLVRWLGVFILVMVFFVTIWTSMKGYHTSNIIFLSVTCFLPAMAAAKLKKIRTEISSRT